ncbi:HET-domain-containing protein, partial [Thozetella sp. PMI_491]
WRDVSRQSFINRQWLFLAPVFTEDKFRYIFNQRRPMPYIEHTAKVAGGFFSRVRQVRIHDAHQQVLVLEDGAKPLVAIKQLQQDKGTYYQREADTLNIIRELDNRHLIKPIATYERGDSLCFVFPWAQGDNLREYWAQADGDSVPRLKRDADLILWVLDQMCGLVKGLEALHSRNCRHGDLKPENLLRFTEGGGRGNILIADVGLAKFHLEATTNRHARTQTMTGTIRYEPPECDDKSDNPRSRGYDIWSLGCIFLEFLIWLLDGQEQLREFNKPGRFHRFWDIKDGRYQVHDKVQETIDEISKRLEAGESKADNALKDVLRLIQSGLLVVSLKGPNANQGGRATAGELADEFTSICDRARKDAGYLFDSSIWRRKLQIRAKPPTLEVPRRADQPRIPVISLQVPSSSTEDNENQHRKLLDNDWEYKADNEFARKILEKIDWSAFRPQNTNAELCDNCRRIDIWANGFRLSQEVAQLKETARICDLCRLFYQTALSYNPYGQGKIEFHRIESAFKVGPDGLPVISIYADPESQMIPPKPAQLGLPVLPEQCSDIQTKIMIEWLRTCDETHHCLSAEGKRGDNALPTRVLDVGDANTPTLCLVEGNGKRSGRYVALSHCWGRVDESRRFCTFKHNIDEFRQHISYERLPPTFRDAVRATRALGIRYLWIDSLCIIQNDEEDWEVESRRMEDVFSSAYCTLAASSANSSDEGFFRQREPRPCIKIDTDRGDFYVCKAIDNFHTDVEEGVLNKRGWVLQERALSRRSIHFTSTQIYWECGEGVHCETLAKLLNPKASFLGDSDFPNSALKYFKGGRIMFFQSIYERYSSLGFTRHEDRPIAIAGLEKRLARTFETRGGYGVFDNYLQRGLLWQRASDSSLSRIQYPGDRHVPSWSWMAFRGPIKYMEIPFDGAAWSQDLESPFVSGTEGWDGRHWGADQSTRPTDLMAHARKLTMERVEMLKRLIFDDPQQYEADTLRCIVVGTEKKEIAKGEPVHWVLVI